MLDLKKQTNLLLLQQDAPLHTFLQIIGALFFFAALMPSALILINKEEAEGEVEDGSRRGVHGDQWANKTNQWNETTEKSEVINLQRQDDPTNHMH